MTRDEMQRFAAHMLQQQPQSVLEGNPYIADPLLDQAANEVCEATDCFWRRMEANIVAGTAEYCAPAIYKPKAVYAVGDDGNEYELAVQSVRYMDDVYGHRTWTTFTTQSQPQTAVALGRTKW